MENIYMLLLESMPYPVWVTDLEGKFIYINRKYSELFQIASEHEFIGKTDVNYFGGEFADFCRRQIPQFATGNELQNFEGIINGHLRECLLFPIIDNKNALYAVAGIIKDIYDENNIKQQLDQLSHRDMLTGLYNRNYFQNIVSKLSGENYLPLSVIMCDINGLRLLNSAFGQAEGDKLIKMLADVLQEFCKEEGYLFRWGGDEFVILLPRCAERTCEKTIKKIIETYNASQKGLLELSLAVGSATTNNEDESIYEIMKEAESNLFRQKLLEEKSVRGSIMFSLQNSLEAKNVETEKHTERMINHSMAIGKSLDLKIAELDELILVTRLHDIGKIGISEDILLKPGKLTDEEFEVMKTHTQKGLRIVEASNELAHIGKGILTHHERWDGKGYPLGLKGEDIPLVSRIVCVVDSYDAMTNDRVYKKGMTKEQAICELKRCAGHQFDPNIVELFIKLIEE